jgi:hypothetical protein
MTRNSFSLGRGNFARARVRSQRNARSTRLRLDALETSEMPGDMLGPLTAMVGVVGEVAMMPKFSLPVEPADSETPLRERFANELALTSGSQFPRIGLMTRQLPTGLGSTARLYRCSTASSPCPTVDVGPGCGWLQAAEAARGRIRGVASWVADLPMIVCRLLLDRTPTTTFESSRFRSRCSISAPEGVLRM